MFYRRLFFPLLRRFDAESTHERALNLLELCQSMPPGRALLRLVAGRIPKSPLEVMGLTFPNVLGAAAGFDKDSRVAMGLALLGFGHVEVGTITPRPQTGNPRPRIFRSAADLALLNSMGFPNQGAAAILPRLKALAERERSFVLGVSLGKQKDTSLAEAAGDYLAVMKVVYPYADYLVVNVSSPNTSGLRALQGRDYLDQLLADLMSGSAKLAREQERNPRPILVKIAPDLSWSEIDEILAAVDRQRVSGIIATNTSASRVGLSNPRPFGSGGVSGRPLAARSNEVLAYIRQQMGPNLALIGVGGIFSADDIQAKLDAGADLVQVYTGFVYGGPGMPGRVLRRLSQASSKGSGD